VDLDNVTVARNSATSGGGVQQGAGTFDLDNTLVGDNTAETFPDCSGTFVADDYNLVENPDCAGLGTTDVQNQDPELKPLDKNGGPTKTHALKKGSPAIDAGDPDPPDDADNCQVEDQRDKLRDDERCDIGAYEKT
jgi:hypothetical protein